MGGRAAVVLSGIVQYLNQLNVQLPEAADGKMLNSPSCSTSSLLDPVWTVQTAVQLRRYPNILLLPKNILHCDCQPSHDYQMKPLMASFHESKALCSLLAFVSPQSSSLSPNMAIKTFSWCAKNAFRCTNFRAVFRTASSDT